jgi:leucyl/phenylalanyl-tRNA---protein transferase
VALTLLHPLRHHFPAVEKAEPDGLLAVGGDLSMPRLLEAYCAGIFPWSDDPLTWWSPDPRAIFEIDQFTPQKRLLQKITKGLVHITHNQAFTEVITGCAAPARGREETWISPRFVEAYTEMHRAGYAHSVEVWQKDQLVGGLYGVAIGGFFAGESMFHRVSDASKIALTSTILHLQQRGFLLFDTQVATPVTRQLGALDLPRALYLKRLATALARPVQF